MSEPLTIVRLLASHRPAPTVADLSAPPSPEGGGVVWITRDYAVSITGGSPTQRVAAIDRMRARARREAEAELD